MAQSEKCQAPPADGPRQAKTKKLDPLVRYMIFHWILGTLGGALCATLLLVFDPFGIRPLIHDSGLGVQAVFLLYVGFMTSFGGLVCAAAVMFPPKDDDEPPRGGGLRGNVVPAKWRPRLAPVRAQTRP
ncbi:hypothetical protein [Roseiarcus sp.]|uniref:hypothetical protein n=1 Tax=Roseiarcus sp. TaxID=1969460 RepID=UPI003F9D0207